MLQPEEREVCHLCQWQCQTQDTSSLKTTDAKVTATADTGMSGVRFTLNPVAAISGFSGRTEREVFREVLRRGCFLLIDRFLHDIVTNTIL